MSTCPTYDMAKVLAEMVPEIKDRTACRHALAFAGFSDEQISVHLRGAQHLARKLRGEEADRLHERWLRLRHG